MSKQNSTEATFNECEYFFLISFSALVRMTPSFVSVWHFVYSLVAQWLQYRHYTDIQAFVTIIKNENKNLMLFFAML